MAIPPTPSPRGYHSGYGIDPDTTRYAGYEMTVCLWLGAVMRQRDTPSPRGATARYLDDLAGRMEALRDRLV